MRSLSAPLDDRQTSGNEEPLLHARRYKRGKELPTTYTRQPESGRSGAKCAGEESSWPTQLASYNPPMLLAQGKVQVDTVRPLYVPAGDHQVV